MTTPAPARGRAVAFGLLAGAGLVGLLVAGRPWWRTTGATVTGNAATASLAGVLAGALAAGTALALLSARRGRTVLGVLLGLLAAAMIALGFTVTPGATDPGRAMWARYAYPLCGLLALAGAGILTARARTWPERADRFTRAAGRAGIRATDDPAEVWKALDAGHDPTGDPDGPGSGDTSGQNPPDRGE